MQFQTISILRPQKGLEFLGDGEGYSVRLKYSKKCMKLNWNFQRSKGGGVFMPGRLGYLLELLVVLELWQLYLIH